MHRSVERILTTHTGSLVRPGELLALAGARTAGDRGAEAAYAETLREAVGDVVTKQVESGIDVVGDGELSKPNFADYVADRLAGLEGENPEAVFAGSVWMRDYPEYFAQLGRQQGVVPNRRPLCIGPLSWKNKEAIETDIDNLKAALVGVDVSDAFIPSPSPGIVEMRIPNAYYPNDEAYLEALAGVLGEEYRAIVDAGFLLQIDAPDVPMSWPIQFGAERFEDYARTITLRNEALNLALEGIPEESIRYHVCWGNVEMPHNTDIDLSRIIDLVLKVNAQAYSIEAANPRHAHEWEIWRDVKLPDGKILIPGVIDSTTNYVEHPDLVAQRIGQYADLVGRENVIAGTDCGFGTFASASPRVHPTVVWGKLRSLAEGSAIASKRLWK